MSWLTGVRNGLAGRLVRVAMAVYPPYELRRLGPSRASRQEDTDASSYGGKRWDTAEVQQTHLAVAEMIYRAELDRKKTIEDKATNFLAGATLSSGILIALPTLLAEKTSAPVEGRFFMLAMFTAAVAYLVGSAMYAIRVRASGEYYVVNASSLEGIALTSDDFRRKWALRLLDMTRRNQGFLLQKTNELYVAERLFFRGLQTALLAGLLLATLAIAYPLSRISGPRPEVGSESTLVLYDALVKCHEENSTLTGQVATQNSALAELKAQLDAKSESSRQVTKKASANTNSSSNQSSKQAAPAVLQGGCLPPGSKATKTPPSLEGGESVK